MLVPPCFKETAHMHYHKTNHVIQKPFSALWLKAYITLHLQEDCGCHFWLICFVQSLSLFLFSFFSFLRQYATTVDRHGITIFPLSLHFLGVLTL